MISLTRRQRVCLAEIAKHEKRTGVMPNLEELRIALRLSSRSSVSRLLFRLEQRGAIKRMSGCARAMAIEHVWCPHCGKDLHN